MKIHLLRSRKVLLLAGSISGLAAGILQAGSEPPSETSDLRPLRSRSITFREVNSRELCDLSEKVSARIDETRKALEEWGTLAISGLVAAPPDGTFATDINNVIRKDGNENKKYDFNHWFTQAGNNEGSVAFTERIFNSLAASGTLQLAPEEAAVAGAIFQKQKSDEQLFQQQLEINRVRRGAELDDFKANRANATQARQVKIDNAQAAADRARTARSEVEVARNSAVAQRNTALQEMDAAQRNLDAVAPTTANSATRASLAQVLQQKQTAYDQANQQLKTINDDLVSRQNDDKTAQDALADAKASSIATGVLPGAQVTLPDGSPTFGQQNFAFTSVATPGETFTQAKSFASAIPVAKPSDLPTTSVPDLLGAKAGIESAFPARARLVDAASNQVISRILDFLGDPSAALQFQDKPILMAAGTIAVNPGWRTWQDYDGQVDAHVALLWRPARQATCQRIAEIGKLKGTIYNQAEISVAQHFSENGLWPVAGSISEEDYTDTVGGLKSRKSAPLVAAVSPLMERQNLDEASSRARQDEIALFLSASLAKSGQKAAGEIFDKYIKLRRLDVKTLSSLPVVNSYGIGGTDFGFNITSRLQAVGNTSSPKAAQILEKQNFPVLVVFGMSADDLRPRLVKNGRAAELWEPYISMTQAHRWTRQKKRGDLHQTLRSIVFPGFPGRPMQSMADSYGLMNRLDSAFQDYNIFLSRNSTMAQNEVVSSFTNLSREDADFLRQASFGTETKIDIPVEYLAGPVPGKKAGSTRVSIAEILPSNVLTPTAVTVDGKTTWESQIVLAGNNLDGVDVGTIVADNVSTITSLPLEGLPAGGGLALKLTFKTKPTTPIQLKLPLPKGANSFIPMVYSPMISFRY